MVRNYKRKTAAYDPEMMRQAVEQCHSGAMGYKKAAKMFNVNISTLKDQARGKRNKMGAGRPTALPSTALHWACKRNHGNVVQYLLEKGADKLAVNNEGLIPAQLTSNEDIRQMLGAAIDAPAKIVQLPITPNYLANPPFPYSSKDSHSSNSNSSNMETANKHTENPVIQKLNCHSDCQNEELVLKARIANSDEKDFIEVELTLSSLNFTSLLNLLCAELGVDKNLVAKIRKLPDTIVRKDKDVKRLKDYQELELVLTNKAMSSASRTYCLGPARNNETILY